MTTNLNQIDELRRRSHVSYEDAKDALEKNNGDMVGALIYLEKQHKIKPDKNCNFFDTIKGLVKKGNHNKFVIQKKDSTIVSLSVTLSVIITLFAPHIVILGLFLALITGHRIKLEGSCKEGIKINKTLDKISDVVDGAKKKFSEND